MKTILAFCLATGICTCVSGAALKPVVPDNGLQSRYIQYLYGVILLTGSPSPDSLERIQRFNELTHITGLTSTQFNLWVLSFKNRPQQWKTVHDSVVQIIDKEEKKWQTSMSANLPTRILKPKR
jgi:hypothetical protein